MKFKKTVLLVFGTRPEAIKLVPLIKRLERSQIIDLKICISAQHREMLDSVLNEYGVRADFDLDLMRERQTLDHITSGVISKVGEIYDTCKPDIVLVHGDTTTAFASALAAFYRKIPIGHIEAGLRSKNILSPYPEEFNRRAISLLASYHFSPTPMASETLIAESVDKNSVFTVGNTAIDMLIHNLKDECIGDIKRSVGGRRYILITVHRREHGNDQLSDIFSALRRICLTYSDTAAIYPLHKNPILRQKAAFALGGINNLLLCEPLATKEFHSLLKDSYLVLTDSGGIQEEAAFLGKPTLVLRDTTERPEGIALGVLRLVGTDPDHIFDVASRLLESKEEYDKAARPTNVFGDGHASERITEIIEKLS